MLRITLEMVPYGFESVARELGVMEICNVGGDDRIGTYRVTVTQGDKKREVIISGYQRSLGAWGLVESALSKIDFSK